MSATNAPVAHAVSQSPVQFGNPVYTMMESPPPHNVEAMLVQQLRGQVEFYFSPQNLAKDTFLQSQLNATDHLGALPIHVLCGFPKVRQMSAMIRIGPHVPLHMTPPADPGLLMVALEGSAVVSVSEDGLWVIPKDYVPSIAISGPTTPTTAVESAEMQTRSSKDAALVTPNHTVPSAPSSPSSEATGSSSVGVPTHPLPLTAATTDRSTVVVHDTPEKATRDQLVEAFSTVSSQPKDVRQGTGNTWLVSFETEDEALSALAATSKSMICGLPIQGCLKSEFISATAATMKSSTQVPVLMSLPNPAFAGGGDDSSSRNPHAFPGIQRLGQVPPGAPIPNYMGVPTPFGTMPSPQPMRYGYAPIHPYESPMTHSHQSPARMHLQQHYVHQGQQYLFNSGGYGSPYHTGMRSQHAQAPFPVPPPHVYLQPQQHQPRNTSHRRQNRNRKGRNNSKQHSGLNHSDTNGMVQAGLNNVDQRKSHRSQGSSKRPKGSSGPQHKSKQGRSGPKHSKTAKDTKYDKAIDLTTEQFPALGGDNKTEMSLPSGGDLHSKQVCPPRCAYAEALLKPPKKESPSFPEESGGIHANGVLTANSTCLEDDMNRMSFSGLPQETSHDGW